MGKTHDEEDMFKYFAEHIAYERDMLGFTYVKLHETPEGAAWNAFYESFGTHARNLYNFLRNDGGKTTTFRADQYVSMWRPPNAFLSFNDLDTFLFHMSKGRLSRSKLDLQKLQQLGEWLDNEWANWFDQLPSPYRESSSRDPVCPPGLILSGDASQNAACTTITSSSVSFSPREEM